MQIVHLPHSDNDVNLIPTFPSLFFLVSPLVFLNYCSCIHIMYVLYTKQIKASYKFGCSTPWAQNTSMLDQYVHLSKGLGYIWYYSSMLRKILPQSIEVFIMTISKFFLLWCLFLGFTLDRHLLTPQSSSCNNFLIVHSMIFPFLLTFKSKLAATFYMLKECFHQNHFYNLNPFLLYTPISYCRWELPKSCKNNRDGGILSTRMVDTRSFTYVHAMMLFP